MQGHRCRQCLLPPRRKPAPNLHGTDLIYLSEEVRRSTRAAKKTVVKDAESAGQSEHDNEEVELEEDDFEIAVSPIKRPRAAGKDRTSKDDEAPTNTESVAEHSGEHLFGQLGQKNCALKLMIDEWLALASQEETVPAATLQLINGILWVSIKNIFSLANI